MTRRVIDSEETLVELIDLSLQAKHYHWNLTGQEFRGVHLHLDEITPADLMIEAGWYGARMAAGQDPVPDLARPRHSAACRAGVQGW